MGSTCKHSFGLKFSRKKGKKRAKTQVLAGFFGDDFAGILRFWGGGSPICYYLQHFGVSGVPELKRYARRVSRTQAIRSLFFEIADSSTLSETRKSNFLKVLHFFWFFRLRSASHTLFTALWRLDCPRTQARRWFYIPEFFLFSFRSP